MPQRAVQELQNLTSVAVVDAGNKVAFRTVKDGSARRALWVIEEGLKPGEQVVTEGLQRIQDGMTVVAKPAPAEAAGRAGAASRSPAGERGEVAMARFFVNRPIVAMVMSIITVMLGLVAMQRPADRAVSRNRAADGPGHDDLHRRQRDRRRGVGRDAARAADQRRRKRHLHEVDQRQRRDLDAQGLVRGRVEPGHGQRAHAEPRVAGQPQMPQSVKNYGVTVKKALAFPLLVISIKSPNGTYDSSFLSNYTTININDAIARIPGVGQINLFGGSDYAMRVWLRPDVIGRLGLTVPDIANAISQQNQLTPAGQIGGPPGGEGHRVHLHRSHAGPPAERGGVRQHHRPDQSRTGRRCC